MEVALMAAEKNENDYQAKLYEMLTIRHFLKNSFISAEYKPIQEFGESILLTSNGEKLALSLLENNNYTISEYKLSIFSIFHSGEFLVDIEKTDLLKLKKAISNEVINGNIRFPWIYERKLYDRFFENFNSRPKKLNISESNFLLSDTPVGVFQLGRNVIGPLGILESEDSRYLPVTKKAPLWHCNNLACNSLHFVELTSEYEKTKFGQAADSLRKEPLPKFLDNILRESSGESIRLDYDLGNLPLVLINAFSEVELKNLLEKLIVDNSYFWGKNPKNGALDCKFSGSAKQISRNVNLSECFQMILLFKNIDIISSIENLIFNNKIKIPNTEIRTSLYGYNRGNSLNMRCEVSSLGVRFISNNRDLPSLRLKHLIMTIYKDKEELDWKLRLVEGLDVNHKYENLLMNENPKQIVKDFLLDNPKHIKYTFNYLLIKNFETPKDSKQEEILISKILWKLGFDISSFPEYLQRYWERLDEFSRVSFSLHSYNEEDKEKIRSSAVNLFVSVEEILDASLSFITWILLSDHYGDTKFNFNLDNARNFMSHEISGKKVTNSGPIMYDENGKNTLYPLIQGFSILADYCEELILDRDKHKRVSHDIPSYISDTDLFVFPFMHNKFVLDLPEEVNKEIFSLLKKLTLTFEQNNVASVRNRIEHKRNDFPEKFEIDLACNALREIGEVLENNGICPTVYQFNETYTDTFGRGHNTYINYKGSKVKINRSSQYNLAKLPALDAILVLTPAIKLENSNQPMRFRYSETSEFTRIYKGYPRRETS